jgi:E1A/CREB-binding protein
MSDSELSEKDIKELNDLLDTLLKEPSSIYFAYPVDVEGLGLKDYLELIKKPMDISTVRHNIESGVYKHPYEALDDIQLIWDNCKRYNMEGYDIYNAAVRMEKLNDKIVKRIFKNYKKISFMKLDVKEL